jgi:hypothetical protein
MFTISGKMVRLRTISSIKSLMPSDHGTRPLSEISVLRNGSATTRQLGDAVFAYRYLFPGRNNFATDDLHGNPASPGAGMYLAFIRREGNLTEFTPIGSQSARD